MNHGNASRATGKDRFSRLAALFPEDLDLARRQARRFAADLPIDRAPEIAPWPLSEAGLFGPRDGEGAE
jgi:hypothetical protein